MKAKASVLNNYYVKLSLTVIFAFAAAYMMLPKEGKWATLPICLICALAVGTVKIKWLFSAGIFAVTTYILTSFSVGEYIYAVISAAFAALTALAGCLAVWLCKKRKAGYIFAAAVVMIASCLLHFLLFGSPLKAFRASDMLDDYIADTYTDSVTVGGMRYDRKKMIFFVEAHGSNAVTEVRGIYCNGEKITDNYRGYAEISLMADARQKLQNTLREAFPDGKFSVVPKSVSGFPSGVIDVTTQIEDISLMSFDINVTTALTADDFTALGAKYIRVLAANGIHPASVRVRGGDAGEYFLTVKALAVDYPVPVTIAYEPDDAIGRYTVSLLEQNFPPKRQN